MLNGDDIDAIATATESLFVKNDISWETALMQAAYDYGRRVKPLEWLEIDNEACEKRLLKSLR